MKSNQIINTREKMNKMHSKSWSLYEIQRMLQLDIDFIDNSFEIYKLDNKYVSTLVDLEELNDIITL